MGHSRDSFHRFRGFYEKGDGLPLAERVRAKPNLKNRAALEVEAAAMARATKQLVWGQMRALDGLKSQVSRLCDEIDDKIKVFLSWQLESEGPYVWLDANAVKARRDWRVNQHGRAPQRRDQATDRGERHLPEGGSHRLRRRRDLAQTER